MESSWNTPWFDESGTMGLGAARLLAVPPHGRTRSERTGASSHARRIHVRSAGLGVPSQEVPRETPSLESLDCGRPSGALPGLCSSFGAPAAVTALEEAIALGAHDFISFGACGSLVDGLRIGSAVLPTHAFADEGTSKHYASNAWFRPSSTLVRSLRSSARRSELPLVDGGVWTTDAPYRESRERARSLARRGVVGVEMEASAMYAVARHRGARIASLFVVSDELGGEEWNAGFRHPAFLRGKQRALRVVIDALRRELP